MGTCTTQGTGHVNHLAVRCSAVWSCRADLASLHSRAEKKLGMGTQGPGCRGRWLSRAAEGPGQRGTAAVPKEGGSGLGHEQRSYFSCVPSCRSEEILEPAGPFVLFCLLGCQMFVPSSVLLEQSIHLLFFS